MVVDWMREGSRCGVVGKIRSRWKWMDVDRVGCDRQVYTEGDG